jgi:hypothetical protein
MIKDSTKLNLMETKQQNNWAHLKIAEEMIKLPNGVFYFEIRVSNKIICDVVFRDFEDYAKPQKT